MPKGPDLIAERAFFVSGKRNGGPAVVFRLWRPYQPKADYPRCRYELITSKGSTSTEVPGVDCLDCIIASLSMAGSDLADMNESVFGGLLCWEASPEGGRGLGLPTIEDWPLRQ
jgi:hypothetical protein